MSYSQNDNNATIHHEPEVDYEKAEMDLLRDALKRTHSERFKMMATLMKMNIMFRNARITHKLFIDPSIKL